MWAACCLVVFLDGPSTSKGRRVSKEPACKTKRALHFVQQDDGGSICQDPRAILARVSEETLSMGCSDSSLHYTLRGCVSMAFTCLTRMCAS